MTEKRFECFDLIFDGFIKDTLTNENIAEPIKLIHLLNNLNDENDILNQQLKTKYIVNKQYEELQRLKEENEQLKSQVAFANNEVVELLRELEAKIKELEKENDTLKMVTGKELFKEIDNLKEDIQQLEKKNRESHHSKILANAFIIEKGLIKEFIKWSKEND